MQKIIILYAILMVGNVMVGRMKCQKVSSLVPAALFTYFEVMWPRSKGHIIQIMCRSDKFFLRSSWPTFSEVGYAMKSLEKLGGQILWVWLQFFLLSIFGKTWNCWKNLFCKLFYATVKFAHVEVNTIDMIRIPNYFACWFQKCKHTMPVI